MTVKYLVFCRTYLKIALLILGIIGLRMGLTTQATTLQDRVIRVVNADAFTGQTVNVSVEMVSLGNENSVQFSLNFNPAIFTNPVVTLGGGATGATLSTDGGQAGAGRLGITLTYPAGLTFSAGTQQLVNVVLAVPAAAPAGPSVITFDDIPVPRSITDVNAALLTATYTSGTITVIRPNGAPVLISLNPPSTGFGGNGFSLSLTGTNFVSGSVVRWNGATRITNFVSSTRLTALISANDIAAAGTVNVTVVNPPPGGGLSNGVTFSITNPVPSLTSVSPNTATAGSGNVTISVMGSNFVSDAKVRFNNTELGTTFASATQLSATIPAASLAVSGVANITVVNPAPGGGYSNAVTFTVNGPVPTISSLSPNFANTGGPAFNLTVTGTGFTGNSVVRWNDSDRPTTFVSATQLRAAISANDIATAGTYNVKVFSPMPGGGTTAALPFIVAAQVTNVSAASFLGPQLASESIVAGFGLNLATRIQAATTLPLPTNMAGTKVMVRDSLGTDRLALQFYVSPGQANYQLPPDTAVGDATVVVTSGDNIISVGGVQVTRVVPGIFTANANGLGVAAATVLRVKSDNSQVFEPIVRFDTATNRFVSLPVDLGPTTDQLFLVLFGTGFRYRSGLSAVTATVGGVNTEVTFAGPQGSLTGLDQSNIRLPRALAGRGEMDVIFTVDKITANAVKLNIK